MGKGNSYVEWMGEHLTIGKRGKGEGTMCSAATRPERRMRWKGEKRLLQPRQAQPRRRTRRNVNSTRRGYCYDLRRTTSATTATAFHCTPWVVVVVLLLLAPPRTFPSASRAFLTPSPYIHFSPSLPSPSLSLTCHAAPAKPHHYRVLPSVPPAPRPPP